MSLVEANGPLGDIHAERAAQDAKWGQQNHPDRNGLTGPSDLTSSAATADWWKRENDLRVRTNTLAWDGILLEEVFEALAEADQANLRTELVQVAAVAVAWVEDIDRRAAAT